MKKDILVADMLFASAGRGVNTMLIDDDTIIEIKSVNGAFNSCIYGNWYEDKILNQKDAAVKSFMLDLQNNKAYIELEGGFIR